MLLKNLIKDIPKDKKNTIISGLSINSNDVKKITFFLLLKEKNLMVKIILRKQLKKAHLLLFVLKTVVSMIGKLSLLKQTI